MSKITFVERLQQTIPHVRRAQPLINANSESRHSSVYLAEISVVCYLIDSKTVGRILSRRFTSIVMMALRAIVTIATPAAAPIALAI